MLMHNRDKTHCPQGHEYTPENCLWIKKTNGRKCRTCTMARAKIYRDKRKKPRKTAEDRFWEKVKKTKTCWIWSAALSSGYGYFRVGNRNEYAHRFSYELHKKKIKRGLHIDHLCKNTACVNPEHLEPVSQKENIMRGVSPSALNAKKTHCKRGHLFTPKNTYIQPNSSFRACLKCRRHMMRLWFKNYYKKKQRSQK